MNGELERELKLNNWKKNVQRQKPRRLIIYLVAILFLILSAFAVFQILRSRLPDQVTSTVAEESLTNSPAASLNRPETQPEFLPAQAKDKWEQINGGQPLQLAPINNL